MHIVLINHYAGSPTHGMEFRPHQLAARWVERGHEVTIAAGSWSHLRNLNPTAEDRVTEERIDGIRYRWYRTTDYRGNGLRRLWSMRQFTRHLAWDRGRFFRHHPPDCVIASSTYPFDVRPAAKIADDHDVPLIWEVHDLWPLSQIELYGFDRHHPFVILTGRAEKFACRRADRVVSILPKADEHLRTRGMPSDRYVHIPNGICPSESTQALSEPPLEEAVGIVERARQEGRLVVGYTGGHAPNHDLETLLKAAAKVDKDRFCFVLIGSGPSKRGLIDQARKADLTNVHFLDRTTRGRALPTLSMMDAAYVGISKGPLYRFGIGLNKIFDAMFVAKPIVAAYTAGNDPVGDCDCGFASPASDVDGVADALRRLADMDQPLRRAMGERGRAHVLEHHDYRRLADRFLEEIRMAGETIRP